MNLQFTEDLQKSFISSIHNFEHVSGLTHKFYRYPARFSPLFARTVIKAFTNPGDFVLDPFMGGGTTLVEASVLGRTALGTDISSLALFISKVKTTPLSEDEIQELDSWASHLPHHLNLRKPSKRPIEWINQGYQRNLNSKLIWPTRKIIELVIEKIDELPSLNARNFARCVLLRTAQWALDGRIIIPSASQFREKFLKYLAEMVQNLTNYAAAMSESFSHLKYVNPIQPICMQRSVIGIENEEKLSSLGSPTLILTSPPYPGLHILYHRWQINGRKETPAPFWIADCFDGNGASYYTFGDRNTHTTSRYYEELENSFRSLSRIANQNTVFIQLVGFSDPTTQLTKYLSAIKRAGLEEIKFSCLSSSSDDRIWRIIPNRKWYTDLGTKQITAKEVVLFHKLK